jgi:hypothetical protein
MLKLRDLHDSHTLVNECGFSGKKNGEKKSLCPWSRVFKTLTLVPALTMIPCPFYPMK